MAREIRGWFARQSSSTISGPEKARLASATGAEDVAAAVADGALPVGEEQGLPLVRFPLDRTADAHRAVENGTIGKVLVDIPR
jgi:hypothetical protein